MTMIRLFCGLALLLAQSGAASAAEPIPLEEFLKPKAAKKIELSPDGKHIAILIPREESSDMLVLDRATLKPTAAVKQRNGDYIHNFTWVTDDRLVLDLGVRGEGTEIIYRSGELWAINADGSNRRYLFGYRGDTEAGSRVQRVEAVQGNANLLHRQADADHRVLVGIEKWTNGETPFAEIGRLDIRTGDLALDGFAPVRYLLRAIIDHDDQLRFISGTEVDRQLKLFYRPQPGGEWKLLNDAAQTGRSITPLNYTRSGKEIYAIVDDGEGPDFLVRYNPETGQEKLLYRGKTASVDDVVPTADHQDAFALKTYEGRGGYAFIGKSPEVELTKSLMAQFQGDQVIPTSFSADARFATILVESDVNPGEYFLHDRETGKLQSLLKLRSALDPQQMATSEPFSMKARDGLQMYGFITRPSGAGKKLPLVVLPHGGPYGEVDRWGFSAEVQLLASRGYAVLQLNFRGSGGYGADFEQSGFGEWGGKMQDDLTDATHWAIEQEYADPERICLYGISYGGYAALMGAVREPDLYRCAIGYAGVYDLALMKKRGDIRKSGLGRYYLDEVFDKDADWLSQRSPAQRAGEIKAAVMLIHGGEDDRSPPAHAKKMRSALTEAGNEPEWIFEVKEGHGFNDPKNRREMYEKLLAFLDRQIGAGAGKPRP